MKRPSRLIGPIALAAAGLVTLAGCRPGAGRDAPDASIDPPAATDLYVEGVLASNRGDSDRAERLLANAVDVNPDHVMARSRLGDIYRQRGAYESALEQYLALVRLDRFEADNFYRLGLTLQLMQRFTSALPVYERALSLDPDNPKIVANLGLTQLGLGDVEAARESLVRASKLAPDDAAVLSNLGIVYDASGDFAAAERVYRRALELDGAMLVTQRNLASNLISQGKGREARSVLRQVIARSDTPANRKRFGDAYAVDRRWADALEQYDEALSRSPRYFPAMNSKAAVLLQQYEDSFELDEPKRQAAVALWKQSLELNPNQPRIEEAYERWSAVSLFD